MRKRKVKAPTLEEVITDPDFIDELRGGNIHIQEFLTMERMLKIVDFLVVEPDFNDNFHRCFRLPFIACEIFTSEVFAVTRHLVNETAQDNSFFNQLMRARSGYFGLVA